MKKYYTPAVLCLCIALHSYAQRPIDTLPFESVGTMATSTQDAGGCSKSATQVERQNHSTATHHLSRADNMGSMGCIFCSTSTLMLSQSKYASEINWFAAEESTTSGIRRLPNKPSHPPADPLGDIPWELMTFLIACYALWIRLKTRHPKPTDTKKAERTAPPCPFS